jgi:hypothetical protein
MAVRTNLFDLPARTKGMPAGRYERDDQRPSFSKMIRMNIILMFIALTMLMSVSLGCFFATSRTTVRGYVEYGGKPVEGATVTFGPTLGQETTLTGTDGKFTITASHHSMAMLELSVKKPRTAKQSGMVNREKIKFPSFLAPTEEIKVEMIGIIERTR